jgi:hypothetical protein
MCNNWTSVFDHVLAVMHRLVVTSPKWYMGACTLFHAHNQSRLLHPNHTPKSFNQQTNHGDLRSGWKPKVQPNTTRCITASWMTWAGTTPPSRTKTSWATNHPRSYFPTRSRSRSRDHEQGDGANPQTLQKTVIISKFSPYSHSQNKSLRTLKYALAPPLDKSVETSPAPKPKGMAAIGSRVHHFAVYQLVYRNFGGYQAGSVSKPVGISLANRTC